MLPAFVDDRPVILTGVFDSHFSINNERFAFGDSMTRSLWAFVGEVCSWTSKYLLLRPEILTPDTCAIYPCISERKRKNH